MLYKFEVPIRYLEFQSAESYDPCLMSGAIVTIEMLQEAIRNIHVNQKTSTKLSDELLEWLLSNKIHYEFDNFTYQIIFASEEDASFFKLTWC